MLIDAVQALAARRHDADAEHEAGESGGARLVVELKAGKHGHHFLLELLMAAGAKIGSFTPEGVKLEDAFLKLTTGALQ